MCVCVCVCVCVGLVGQLELEEQAEDMQMAYKRTFVHAAHSPK